MRNLLVLLVLIGHFMLALAAADPVRIAANDPAITYVGRWGQLSRNGQPSMATVNSSAQIYLTFTGRHVTGLFDLDGLDCLEQIKVKLDDGPWTLFTLDHPQIDFLPAGLSEGSHHLEIVVKALDSKAARWLMPLRSAVIFRGFELDSGANAERAAVSNKRPRLEFLGDSMTQGDGIVGTNPTAVMNGDALASYAWLTGEALGATHVQIAFPGQGVLTSDSREVPPAIFSFGWNFAGSAADFSTGPDFLVINLGFNDDAISSEEFLKSYVDLLRTIREHCPQTIVFALSPFHGNRHRSNDIEMAVKVFADPLVHYVDSNGWLNEGDFTDRAHLNIAGSKKAAARMEQELRPYLDRWKSEHQ